MQIRTIAFVAFTLALIPSMAAAQPRDHAAADALFQAARAEFDSGEYASACEKFAESNRLDPAPGTLLNLSLCYEKTGKLASAWEGYRQVAEQLHDERVAFASKRSTDLESRLPWVTLRLPNNAPQDTRVFRDGIEMRAAALGVALPVNPGAHTLVVEAPGRLKSSIQFTVEEGQRREIIATLGASEPPRSEKPTSAATSVEERNRTLAWVSGGIGVAGIATSLVAGALAMKSRATVRDHCVDRICDDEGLDAASSGRTYSTVSTFSGVVGFAGLGFGTYLFLTQDSKEAPSTEIEAATLPGGGYVGMTKRF